MTSSRPRRRPRGAQPTSGTGGGLRRLLAASALAFVAGGVALAPVAAAEGPGYGATADALSVTWDSTPAPQAAGPGELAPTGPRLRLQGVGFRGGSTTQVRFGDGATRPVPADDTGTVEAAVAAASVTSAPGTSVVAVGVTPSGSRRVLMGSVPPQASGRGPADLVPVLAGAGAIGLGVSALRRRRH